MKIALFIHQPICAVDSANGIIEALTPHYQIKLFSRDEVEPTFFDDCLLYTSPSPRDRQKSRMPSSA